MIYPPPDLLGLGMFSVAFLAFVVLAGSSATAILAGPRADRFTWRQQVFLVLASGYMVACLVASALAFAGQYNKFAIGLAVAIAILLGGIALRSRRPQVPANGVWFGGLATLAVLACSPVLPSEGWDNTMYHLPVARDVVRFGGLVVDPTIRFPLFPQTGESLMALPLLVGSPTGVGFIATFPIVISIAGMACIVERELRPATAFAISCVLYLVVDELQASLGIAMVDNIVGAMIIAAIVCVQMATFGGIDGRHRKRLIIAAGLFAGTACGTKYIALPLAAITSTVIWWRFGFRNFLIFVGASLVAGGAWYFRAILISGDPFHPFGARIFGYYLWDAGDLALQVAEQRDNVTRSPFPEPLRLLWRAWGLVIGVFAALSLSLWRSRPHLRPAIVISVAYLMIWLLASKVVRYLLPAFPIVFALVGIALASFVPQLLAQIRQRLERLMPLLLVMAMAALAIMATLRMNQRLLDWRADQQNGVMRAFAIAREISPQTPILQLGFENTKDFSDRTIYGDWFGPYRYRQFASCGRVDGRPSFTDCSTIPPEKMAAAMRELGARVLIVNTDRFQPDLREYSKLFLVRNREGNAQVLELAGE